MWRTKKTMFGYTILEVLIVIAVSSITFVIAATTLGGRQQQVQFTQGVRDLESKLRDISNDVATGFFPTSDNIICEENNQGELQIDTRQGAVDVQGTSDDCVFIGKVVQFNPDGNGGQLAIHSVVGKRNSANGDPVTNLDEAQPIAVFLDNSTRLHETYELKGIEAVNAKTIDVSSNTLEEFGGVGFFTTFTNNQTSVGRANQTVRFAPISSIGEGDSITAAASGIAGLSSDPSANEKYVDPAFSEQLVICVDDGGFAGRTAALILGIDGSVTVTADFDQLGAEAC